MEDTFGYRIIDKCIDKNILVYDKSNKDGGTVTKKMVYHMLQNALSIDSIVFSPEVYFDFIPIDWEPNSPLYAFGIELIRDARLATWPDGAWLAYYKLRSGSLNGLEYLAIGLKSNKALFELKEDDYIIGAY